MGRLSRDDVETIVGSFPDQEARVLRLIWERQERDRYEGGSEEGMAALGEGLAGILARLGLPPIELLEELRSRWEELAGRRWGSQSVPIVVRHGELMVVAADRRIVRWLHHDRERLIERLQGHFGRGFVTKVRVVAPLRGEDWQRYWTG